MSGIVATFGSIFQQIEIAIVPLIEFIFGGNIIGMMILFSIILTLVGSFAHVFIRR